jgi:hypothetical protein
MVVSLNLELVGLEKGDFFWCCKAQGHHVLLQVNLQLGPV